MRSNSWKFLIMVACSGFSFSSNAQRSLELLRPDDLWVIGSQQVNIQCFGLSYLNFQNGKVAISEIDSIGEFAFNFSNVSYHGADFFLAGDGCQLMRNLTDSVESHAHFGTDGYRFELCNAPFGRIGYQALLPIGEDMLVYVSELNLEGFDPGWAYTTPGFGVSYLSVDSLSSQREISQGSAALQSFAYISPDSLLDETIDFISDGLGAWWGVGRSAVSNRFHLWRITPDTLIEYPTQSLGLPGYRRERKTTRLHFRPAGDVFAISGTDDGIAIYNFDRMSGDISLMTQIPVSYDPSFVPYRTGTDCAWSANGRFLYVTSRRHVYQFDTYAPDIAASGVRLNDPAAQNPEVGYYEIERGPDCRMYMSYGSSAKTISVIDKPNRPGAACELKDKGIKLSRYYFASLPNFPEYSLWAKDRVARGLAPRLDTAVCDSTIRAFPYDNPVFVTEASSRPERSWHLAPNLVKAGAEVRVRFEGDAHGQSSIPAELTVEIIDAKGARLPTQRLAWQAGGQFTFPAPAAAGLYWLTLHSRGGEDLGSGQLVVGE